MLFSSLIILEKLINNDPASVQQELLDPLSENIKKELDSTPLMKENLDILDFSFDKLFSFVNYTWYLSFFEKLKNDEEKNLFLNILPKDTKEKIKQKLPIENINIDATNFAKKYLISSFIKSVFKEDEEILPKKYIPKDSLFDLLNFSKEKLILLIDFLALFDLMIERKKVVNPKILTNLENYLSNNKKQFLKKITDYKEEFYFPSLNLNEITTSKEKFLKALHKRGINKLAIAISSSHPSFIWHLTHILDIGRGKTLLKLSKRKVDEKIINIIISNISDIISFIKEDKKI